MNIGRACGIFMNIDSDNFTEDEKLVAIRDVLKEMVTYNGITKDNILKAFRWFFDWAVEETVKEPVDIPDLIRLIEEQPRVGEWIPCSDCLPDEEGMYLITARVYDKKEIQYAFYQKEIGLFICNGTAIAWMPLPSAYKEGEDGDN